MKIIKVVGVNNYDTNMFILELAWTMSLNHKVYCQLSDDDFYKSFSFENLEITTFGNLSIVRDFKESMRSDSDIDFVFTTKDVASDYVMYLMEQSLESVKFINKNYDYQNEGEDVFVYLNFIDSCYDGDYFKKFHLNKDIDTTDVLEFEIEFVEMTKICEIENQLNGVISLKKYPRGRKRNLYNIAKAMTEGEVMKYREFYKKLDSRVSTC